MKLLIYFIILSMTFQSYSQSKLFTQEAIDTFDVDSKSIEKIIAYRKALESKPALIGWAKYYSIKGMYYLRFNENDSALYYANKGIKVYENSNKANEWVERAVANAYFIKARDFRHKKDFYSSTQFYQKALEVSKKYDYKWKSFYVSNIAINHYQLGNDSLALKYFLEASKDNVYMSLSSEAIPTYKNIGELYAVFGEINKAKDYFNRSVNRSLDVNEKAFLSSLYRGLASIYYNEKKVDSVIYFFKRSLVADEKYGISNYEDAENENLFVKSYIEIYEGNLEKSIVDLKIIINHLKQKDKLTLPDKDLMMRVCDVLGIAYQKKGNYKEYQNLLKESFQFLERFYKGKLKENLQNLETQYQTKQKDASIAQLEENKHQQSVILKQQKEITYGLGGFLILFSGLGYLFWRQQKLKNQYVTENLKQRLLRSQMNPHFIGNAMNTVSALVEKKSKNTIPYINKLSNLFRLVLTNSREEFVSLEDEITTIKSYLELQSNFSTVFDFNFLIDKSINHEEVIIPPMLIQPFVENAIVHGLSLYNNEKRGQINVEITKQDDKGLLLCTITDNGVSYKNIDIKTSKKHTSVSGDIIKERLKILKRKFNVNSRVLIKKIDEGTKVELYLPFLIDD